MAEPDSIPDLSGWWDASDDSTIVESPAGFCQSIGNKGGTAKTYSQASSGARPAIATVQGMQGLVFDGSTKWMGDDESNAVLQPGAGDFTVVEVLLIDPAVQTFAATWTERDSAGVESWGLQGRGAMDFTARDGAGDLGQLVASDETFNDGTTIWVVMGVSDGNDMNVHYGSAASGSLSASSSNPADRSLVGDVDAVNSALGNLPDTQPASGYWEGTLFKWLFYKRALSAGELTMLFENLIGIGTNPPFGAVASQTPASAALLDVPVQQATGDVTSGPASTRSRQRYFNQRLSV